MDYVLLLLLFCCSLNAVCPAAIDTAPNDETLSVNSELLFDEDVKKGLEAEDESEENNEKLAAIEDSQGRFGREQGRFGREQGRFGRKLERTQGRFGREFKNEDLNDDLDQGRFGRESSANQGRFGRMNSQGRFGRENLDLTEQGRFGRENEEIEQGRFGREKLERQGRFGREIRDLTKYDGNFNDDVF